jgi:hypothetical protein
VLATDLIAVLGMASSDSKVASAISSHELSDVLDHPGICRYVGSRSKGVDLLIEDERVVDVQIHVQRTQSRAPFSDTLPFGLRSDMTQDEVHQLLGPPRSADKIDSKYLLPNTNHILTVAYDKQCKIRYISIGLPLE